MIRRSKLAVVLVIGAALAVLSGCSSAPAVEETGNTTTVEVRMVDGFYVPDVIEVPTGDRLVIELFNDDGDLHDLELENGAKSSRFGKGQSETLEVGVIAEDLDGWCTIPPHRANGMVLEVRAVDSLTE